MQLSILVQGPCSLEVGEIETMRGSGKLWVGAGRMIIPSTTQNPRFLCFLKQSEMYVYIYIYMCVERKNCMCLMVRTYKNEHVGLLLDYF